MPKKAIDYSRTIIYKIVCNDFNIIECYVGHTTDIVKRRNKHKHNCNNPHNTHYNIHLYQFVRANGGWNNWSVVPIEEFSCQNLNQAKIRERHWIEELKASLNKVLPTRTDKEYREDNKDNRKEYLENNKEKIAEKTKEYREIKKERIVEKKKEYYQNNKEKIAKKSKEYYHNRKEELKEKSREYYMNNKEKIAEKELQKITCGCGSCFRKSDTARHIKSKKHQDYVFSLS